METTGKFVIERSFWWEITKSAYKYMYSCHGYQLVKMVPKYKTTLRSRLAILLDTFPINFAGLLPQGRCGENIYY